jgi:hypothetical protein
MKQTEDRSSWRTRVLSELFDHPDVLEADQEWLSELGDGELELLLSKVRDADDLEEALDALRSYPDRER